MGVIMKKTRIKLGVYLNLDPIPGAFHTADNARNHVAHMLRDSIEHYDPVVSVDSYDTSVSRPEQDTLRLVGNDFIVCLEHDELYIPKMSEEDVAEFLAPTNLDRIYFFGTYGMAEV
jgi:hypothetical protein